MILMEHLRITENPLGLSINEDEFAQLDNSNHESELIDYIIMITIRHLDKSNTTINFDFTEIY